MLVHLVLGTLYCWGNFVSYVPPAMRRLDGAAAAPGSPGDALIAFPLTILVQCGTMPFGARAVERFGPRAATLGGGGLVALGVFLASFATTLRAFLACYSGLVGAGIALAYTAPLVAGWSWFPDARGFVNGAVLMGGGGFFFNLLGTRLANPGGLALVYGAVVAVGGSLVAPRPAAAAAAAAADRTPARAIVLSRNFGVLYAATVLCASAGLTSASVYKVFATTAGHGDGFLPPSRPPSPRPRPGPRAFLATVAAAFFCLGGIFSMVPSAVGLLFGRGDAARAYALLFNAFAVASLGGVSAAKALIPRLGWPALYHALAAATLAAAGLTLLLDI
ncbi:monocarboxylate transporter [Aureococcus anophagefferens]|nr:monocarboxylate transporter [Aureococcus anophagefferens]